MTDNGASIRQKARKCAIGLIVDFPPNASTPPHRHGGASVVGYVISGTTLNKMNDEPMKTLKQGDTWYEAPGCHHKISANASATEPMTLLATFVVDSKVIEEGGFEALVQIDKEYRDAESPKADA
ncbi:hypothetical protein LTR35_000191 [Friedmanniomyces endolithicus]|uniref:Cupin type-2 domain-containing protein n=1 Tax=Friedmanniomyces endolithicus TaxID=329885 RepID=A0AAN6FTA6_9PEZI|nr:hypothetical protein LTS00_011029 [Friedmanniomyces endolithicus]KAK0293587.1 hypothetical protein LTR35_000191 [Friedmanniomyces endolithicus]KAK0324103.1 hypothetical protein LTR82_004539 [Friedmanniomyces endolithicus]KAK0992893.1 hypothetical protein LTR54_011213 [Friedmanniomyces endolithicus]